MRTSGFAVDEINMATAHPARMYDYFLGAKTTIRLIGSRRSGCCGLPPKPG
ncbi:hypothetical protein FDG2_4329 [Candidatus Protofrankia californiensis]|uniref:Uncharacterized protein n=1 Tax=Candidatus Protofrankia californiensis TaxID=1839754 RepID=A0A1C3P4Y5_9ACTN|nr:hypothetical protein FDG2_4329 [Candidatus Protofrankia californiensis]